MIEFFVAQIIFSMTRIIRLVDYFDDPDNSIGR